MTLFLDCTLRDGGYCNEWGWSRETARQCYLASVAAGCGICEVGFRRSVPDKGVLYYTPEPVLADWFGDLRQNHNTQIALMAQMGTFTLADFPEKKDSVADMVRLLIAYHAVEQDDTRLDLALVDETVAMADALVAKGYLVSINIGRADKLTDDMWETVMARMRGKVGALYFADTYGSISLAQISRLAALCNKHSLRAGFHFHNNMENGGEKAHWAIAQGCDYIDGTMGGFGRGSGNTKLECICPNPLAVLIFVDEHLYGYQDAKERDFQGYNVLYFLTALYKFHVNYAIELIHDLPKQPLSRIADAYARMQREGKGNYYVKGAMAAMLAAVSDI